MNRIDAMRDGFDINSERDLFPSLIELGAGAGMCRQCSINNASCEGDCCVLLRINRLSSSSFS